MGSRPRDTRAERGFFTSLLRSAAVVGTTSCLACLVCASLVVAGISVASSGVELHMSLGRMRALAQRTVVYAADGQSVLGVLGEQDREIVPLSAVPKTLRHAVIATEDSTFWQNPGINVAAMVRALMSNLRAGSVEQGGSTITQQLVKNRLLTPKRNLRRKVKEMVLALAMTDRFSKRDIFEEYLNTVYFGQGAYGVKTAAERFFVAQDPGGSKRGKHLDELTLGESALLAGVISSPEGDNPFFQPDNARARRAEVLDEMVRHGYATREEATTAAAEPLPTVLPPAELKPRNYIVSEVQRRLLADPRLGATPTDRERALLTGGLRVVTTIDPAAQQRAYDAMAAVLPDQPPFTAALVAVEVATGAIRAMIGGPGFDQLQYNLVTAPPGRQAGSTYKVITLAAALEAGYSPNDTIDASSPCVVEHPPLPPWPTENAEPGGGVVTLRDATAHSLNCAFGHLIASLGPQAVVDMAHRLGITQDVPPYLSITLGTKESTPLEMATVAATLAGDGVRHDPILVAKVTDAIGNVLFDDGNLPGRRVLAPEVARCEASMLRDVVTRGTGTAAAIPGHDVAGKTGTTDQKTDAWFIGYTPQMATAVWMGAPAAQVPMRSVGGITVFGGTYPARIWRQFMSAQISDAPNAAFSAPGPVCDRPGRYVSDRGRGVEAPPPPPEDESARDDKPQPPKKGTDGPTVTTAKPGKSDAAAPPPTTPRSAGA